MSKLKSWVGVAIFVLLSLTTPLAAQQPTVYGPGSSSSVAFWYLGGAPTCCSGLTNKYWIQSSLTIVPPNNGVLPLRYGASSIGYSTLVTHGVADILGTTLTPIDLNETLENQQVLAGNWAANVAPPTATGWPVALWSGNIINDYLTACASGTASLNPRPASYNASGTTKVFDETQKFWIGTQTHFAGVCVQRGIVTLYTDHGTVNSYTTPIINKADCNAGNVIN